VKLLLNKDLHY